MSKLVDMILGPNFGASETRESRWGKYRDEYGKRFLTQKVYKHPNGALMKNVKEIVPEFPAERRLSALQATNAANDLINCGFAVFPGPLLDPKPIQDEFIKEMRMAPEFKVDPGPGVKGALGAFAACALPTSFHGHTPRANRNTCHNHMKPIWTPVCRNLGVSPDETEVEMLIDRAMLRQLGRKYQTDTTAHRDTPVEDLHDDNQIVFGGWHNTHSSSTWFSCIPGSHIIKGKPNTSGIDAKLGGFVKFSKKDQQRLKFHFQEIEVPSGHIILFVENIIHRVLPSPTPDQVMTRFFHGYRILLPGIPERLRGPYLGEKEFARAFEEGEAPLLKSLQAPPLFPKRYLGLPDQWKDMEDYAKLLIDDFVHERIVQTGKHMGHTHWIPRRTRKEGMPSLKAIGAPFYVYSKEERRKYRPQRISSQ
jgi:hypothetical protein